MEERKDYSVAVDSHERIIYSSVVRKRGRMLGKDKRRILILTDTGVLRYCDVDTMKVRGVIENDGTNAIKIIGEREFQVITKRRTYTVSETTSSNLNT